MARLFWVEGLFIEQFSNKLQNSKAQQYPPFFFVSASWYAGGAVEHTSLEIQKLIKLGGWDCQMPRPIFAEPRPTLDFSSPSVDLPVYGKPVEIAQKHGHHVGGIFMGWSGVSFKLVKGWVYSVYSVSDSNRISQSFSLSIDSMISCKKVSRRKSLMWPWRPVPNGHCQIRFNKGIHVRSVFPSPPNPQHLGVCWRVGLRYVALRMPTLLQATYSEAPMVRVPVLADVLDPCKTPVATNTAWVGKTCWFQFFKSSSRSIDLWKRNIHLSYRKQPNV